MYMCTHVYILTTVELQWQRRRQRRPSRPGFGLTTCTTYASPVRKRIVSNEFECAPCLWFRCVLAATNVTKTALKMSMSNKKKNRKIRYTYTQKLRNNRGAETSTVRRTGTTTYDLVQYELRMYNI